MKKLQTLISGCCMMLLLVSCSKEEQNTPDTGFPNLEGNIFYEFAGKVFKVDLSTGLNSIHFSYNTYSFVGWDFSMDGQFRLISERKAGNYTSTSFRLLSVPDERIIKEFEYIPPHGNKQRYSGKLSYDNSMILLQPDYHNGIVILNAEGEIEHHLEGINDEKITLGDEVIWLPDNSILLTFQNRYIFRSSPPFTKLTLVKEMDYEQWGNLNVSRDGSRISLYIGNHIYLMDIDGKGLAQVTDSERAENMGIFSPDGRHLLVGTDYVHAPVSGSSVWTLKIIPADGKMYHLDKDPAVVPVKPLNESAIATVSGNSFWMQ